MSDLPAVTTFNNPMNPRSPGGKIKLDLTDVAGLIPVFSHRGPTVLHGSPVSGLVSLKFLRWDWFSQFTSLPYKPLGRTATLPESRSQKQRWLL